MKVHQPANGIFTSHSLNLRPFPLNRGRSAIATVQTAKRQHRYFMIRWRSLPILTAVMSRNGRMFRCDCGVAQIEGRFVLVHEDMIFYFFTVLTKTAVVRCPRVAHHRRVPTSVPVYAFTSSIPATINGRSPGDSRLAWGAPASWRCW